MNRLSTPDSQPNASQITNAVESGMIVAASTLAPNSPTAKSASASRPATGSSALAASAAEVIVPLATPMVLAAATTMKIAMTLVHTDPPIASACSSASSSTPMPFSATALVR